MSCIREINDKKQKEICSKRWTAAEVNKFLEILIAEGKEALEKPTAQIFYKKILNENKEFFEGFNWMGMRDKLKYLKKKYKKAIDWRKHTGAGLMEDEDGSSVQAYIEKICPEFEDMEVLFGYKGSIQMPLLVDSEESSSHLLFEDDDVLAISRLQTLTHPQTNARISNAAENSCTPIPVGNVVMAGTEEHEIRNTPSCRRRLEKGRNNYERKANYSIALLADVHAETQKTKRLKLEVERERIHSEARLKEKELDFKLEVEKARLAQEFAFKKMELDLKYKANQNSLAPGPDEV